MSLFFFILEPKQQFDGSGSFVIWNVCLIINVCKCLNLQQKKGTAQMIDNKPMANDEIPAAKITPLQYWQDGAGFCPEN